MGHYRSSIIDNLYSQLRRIQRDFDWCYWWFKRHSYIAKLEIISSWYKTKSKATTGVKNTASYIPWLYTTWNQLVASNMIHCVLGRMTTTIIQAFCIKFKKCLFIILKLITHIWWKASLLLWHLWRTVQKLQELYGFVSHKETSFKMFYFSKWMPC